MEIVQNMDDISMGDLPITRPRESSPFRKLPLELILAITSYLRVEYVASLSFSCHFLYASLATQCLMDLKHSRFSVKVFLRLLERGLPDHILCPHCNKLHSMSLAKRHSVHQSPLSEDHGLPCRKADLEHKVAKGMYPGFSSTVFHMGMKAHMEGLDTSRLLDLLSHKTKHTFCDGSLEQSTIKALIRDNSLLVREQRVVMVPTYRRASLPLTDEYNICSHYQFPDGMYLYMYGIDIPLACDIPSYHNRQGIICCDWCHTEFRVDFKSYGDKGNAMFITKWMDIGGGQGLGDSKFSSRVMSARAKSWSRIAAQRGSICAAFEGKAESEFKFDSLLSLQDEKHLCTTTSLPWPPGVTEPWYEKIERRFVIWEGRFVFKYW